ncbi:MAG: hypothetical protein H6Q73_3804 [Firmicutes bacterium]|nr:hypothetical protein [Bacillota bacterium]
MADIFSEPPVDDISETALESVNATGVALVGSNFQRLTQIAEYLSKSTIIPVAYQNKSANCLVAVEYAQRIGCTAMMVMQNMDVIAGKPSWSAKFLTAVANECGRFSPIRYEWYGEEGQDDWGCRAYMTEKATGEVLKGTKVTISMAKAEGWYNKSGSKWKTMPEQMLQYRSAAFLVRTYAPELTMGLLTTEEQKDIINVTPGGPVPAGDNAAERAWQEVQNDGHI